MWISAPRSSTPMPGYVPASARDRRARGRRAPGRCSSGDAGNDEELGQVFIGGGLAHLDARPRAAIEREVRVAAAWRRFPIPDHVQLRVHTAQRIRHQRVRVVLERAILHRRRERSGRIAGRRSHAGTRSRESRSASAARPARGCRIDSRWLRPGNSVHCTRSTRCVPMSFSPSPCSTASKNHGRPDVRRARDHFHQVVNALHVDAGIRFGALDDLAKHLRHR